MSDDPQGAGLIRLEQLWTERYCGVCLWRSFRRYAEGGLIPGAVRISHQWFVDINFFDQKSAEDRPHYDRLEEILQSRFEQVRLGLEKVNPPGAVEVILRSRTPSHISGVLADSIDHILKGLSDKKKREANEFIRRFLAQTLDSEAQSSEGRGA